MKKKHPHKYKPLQELYTLSDHHFQSKSSDSLKAYKLAEDLKRLQNDVNSPPTSVEHCSQDVFACQVDDSSCLSDDNGLVMTSAGHIGGMGDKNLTSSAASVSNSCLEVKEKPVTGDCNMTGLYVECLKRDVDNCLVGGHVCSSEAALVTLYSSDRLDLSEISSCRDKLDDALLPPKDEPLLCSKELVNSAAAQLTDSDILLPKENNHDSLMPENQPTDGNSLSTDSFSRSNGKDCLESAKPITNTLELPSHSQNITHSGVSDELVDVRVCDICGDSGREALLALCSKCTDGAEHIYCMRTKLDYVPEDGWMCEDCSGSHEQTQRSQVLVRKLDRASNLCMGELKQSSPGISPVQQVGEIKTFHSSKASFLVGKRHGTYTEMTSTSKKETFERGTQSIRSSSCERKTPLTLVSSLKIMDKGKTKVPKVSAMCDRAAKRKSDHRSPKSEKRFCKGSVHHSNPNDIRKSNMNARHLCENVLKRSAGKECADNDLERNYSSKQLLKPLSFIGVTSGPLNLSNDHSAYVSTVKGLNHEGGQASSGNHNVSAKKANALGLSGSGCMKAYAEVVAERVKAVPSSHHKAVQVGRNSKIKAPIALARKAKNCSNELVVSRSIRDKLPPCQSGHVMRSPSEKVNCFKAECDSIRNCDGCDLVSTKKVETLELCSARARHTLVPAHSVPAVPEAEYIWKGGFKLNKSGKLPNNCTGVQAHFSTCASSKVHELAQKFQSKIMLKEVSRLETWPIQFQRKNPTEQDIALYFFAEDQKSYERSYKIFLDGMTKHDLALEANFDGVQLRIFPSSLLSMTSQRWNSLPFLWGVYIVSKVDDHSSHLPGVDVSTLDQDLCSPVTYGSENKCVSPLETRSSSASYRSFDFLHILDPVCPAVSQTSALTKSYKQSFELEVSSLKCSEAREEHHVQLDMMKSTIDSMEEEIFSGKTSHCDDKMLKGTEYSNQDVKCIGRTDTLPFGQSNRENMASLSVDFRQSSFCSDGSCRGQSVPRVYNSVNQKADLTGRCSFSIDSGPSGSSDGCSKSDEVQGYHSENPVYFGSLNLDLSLGTSSAAAEQVDLNLVLGFPNKCQPKYSTSDGHTGDENMSLVLSLGMPCSDA